MGDRSDAVFDSFVQRYHPSIIAVARRVVGDRETAEDVAVTAFIELDRCRASSRLQRGRQPTLEEALTSGDAAEENGVVAWLRRVATNKALDIVRRRREFTSGNEIVEGTVDDISVGRGGSIEDATLDAIVYGEFRDLVRRALDTPGAIGLSDPQRRALTLHLLHELKPAEVAAFMGYAVDTVRKDHIETGKRILAYHLFTLTDRRANRIDAPLFTFDDAERGIAASFWRDGKSVPVIAVERLAANADDETRTRYREFRRAYARGRERALREIADPRFPGFVEAFEREVCQIQRELKTIIEKCYRLVDDGVLGGIHDD